MSTYRERDEEKEKVKVKERSHFAEFFLLFFGVERIIEWHMLYSGSFYCTHLFFLVDMVPTQILIAYFYWFNPDHLFRFSSKLDIGRIVSVQNQNKKPKEKGETIERKSVKKKKLRMKDRRTKKQIIHHKAMWHRQGELIH